MHLLNIVNLFIAVLISIKDITEVNIISVFTPPFACWIYHVRNKVFLSWQQPIHEDTLDFVSPKSTDVLCVDFMLICSADPNH